MAVLERWARWVGMGEGRIDGCVDSGDCTSDFKRAGDEARCWRLLVLNETHDQP